MGDCRIKKNILIKCAKKIRWICRPILNARIAISRNIVLLLYKKQNDAYKNNTAGNGMSVGHMNISRLKWGINIVRNIEIAQ